MDIKILLKYFLPPVLLKAVRGNIAYQCRWQGRYASWAQAKMDSTGYQSGIILEKTKESLLKVKNNEAVYERDSVLFDEIQYSYLLLSSLMWIAASKGGRLNIVDFGGSLGSSYFQNRLFLSSLKEVKWNIVEQKHFVECGKKYFEDKNLRFYYDIDDCVEDGLPDVILSSGSIQYIESPYDFLEKIISKRFEYIILDRVSFNRYGKDRLTVQRVGRGIYNASYPCWLLDINSVKEKFQRGYDLISEFDSIDKADGFKSPEFGSLLYRRRQAG